MATELVAQPGAPLGTATLPWFDWNVVVGVPVHMFITCFFLFVVIAIFVWWLAKLNKLKAVSGWWESMKKSDPHDMQVWLMTRTQKLFIGCLKMEDNVLSYHDKKQIGMWHHNTRESVIRVGGNPAVVVSDEYDQTRDVVSEIAITDNCDSFNADQAKLQLWKEEHNKPLSLIHI